MTLLQGMLNCGHPKSRILMISASIEIGQFAMDAKSPLDVKSLRGHIYGLVS